MHYMYTCRNTWHSIESIKVLAERETIRWWKIVGMWKIQYIRKKKVVIVHENYKWKQVRPMHVHDFNYYYPQIHVHVHCTSSHVTHKGSPQQCITFIYLLVHTCTLMYFSYKVSKFTLTTSWNFSSLWKEEAIILSAFDFRSSSSFTIVLSLSGSLTILDPDF